MRKMSSFTADHHWISPIVSDAPVASPRYRDLDAFLSEVERRAFVMAELATRDPDEALDLVQDAMLAFVKRYSGKPQAEWAPLFHRVLQNRIRDWARRREVRSRWTAWLHRSEDDETDPLQQAPDTRQRPIDDQLDGLAVAE
jgi:RNA polymerase sigma-70 factor (ECF subfamily)